MANIIYDTTSIDELRARKEREAWKRAKEDFSVRARRGLEINMATQKAGADPDYYRYARWSPPHASINTGPWHLRVDIHNLAPYQLEKIAEECTREAKEMRKQKCQQQEEQAKTADATTQTPTGSATFP